MKTLGKFIIIFGLYVNFCVADVAFKNEISFEHCDDFSVETIIDKNSIFVGQRAKFSLILKYKVNAKFDDLKYDFDDVNGLLIEQVSQIQTKKDDKFITKKIDFSIIAEKSGNFKLPQVCVFIGVFERMGASGDEIYVDFFGKTLKYFKIYSNILNLHVKPLPDGIKLYGKFDIYANVDKQKANKNEPINLTLRINAKGNISSIDKFNLHLPNAKIYTNEPKIEKTILNGENIDVFTQNFLILSDENFTIVPFELNYFDSDLNAVKTVSSDAIFVEILNLNDENLTLQNINKNTNLRNINKVIKNNIFIFLFCIFFIILLFIILKIINMLKFNNKSQISVKILAAKTDRVLFEILLPYANYDNLIDETLKKLEENIYKNKNHKIDKKILIQYFERIINS